MRPARAASPAPRSVAAQGGLAPRSRPGPITTGFPVMRRRKALSQLGTAKIGVRRT